MTVEAWRATEGNLAVIVILCLLLTPPSSSHVARRAASKQGSHRTGRRAKRKRLFSELFDFWRADRMHIIIRRRTSKAGARSVQCIASSNRNEDISSLQCPFDCLHGTGPCVFVNKQRLFIGSSSFSIAAIASATAFGTSTPQGTRLQHCLTLLAPLKETVNL